MNAPTGAASELMADATFLEDHFADFEAETQDEASEGAHRKGLLGFFADMPLGSKLRSLSLANIGAVVFILLSILVGGWLALDLRSDRMEISDAIASASELKVNATTAVVEVQHYALSGNREALESGRTAAKDARRNLNDLEKIAATHLPQHLDTIKALRGQLTTFEGDIDRSRAATDGEQLRDISLAAVADGNAFNDASSELRSALIQYAGEHDAHSRRVISWLFIAFFMVAFAGIALILVTTKVIARDVTRTVGRLTDVSQQLAEGDKHVHIPALQRKDELGDLARSLDVFREAAFRIEEMASEQNAMRSDRKAELQRLAVTFEATVGEVVNGVAAASSQLNTTASSMASTAEQATQQSGAVSQSMETASGGVTAAAAASDEFAMSIGEISRQASHSAELARKAADDAEGADETISTLAASAEQV
ncbi:MAG: HAMP domain-containing protein, partial [Erythrobacter sp.]|nr:HAMP domain-containing protein [Erythrobacter sp.]